MPEEPVSSIAILTASLAEEFSDGSFIVIVQTSGEFSRWLRDPLPGAEGLQVEGLIGDPEVWALAAQGTVPIPLDVVLDDPASEFSALYRLVDVRIVRPVRVTIPVRPGFFKALCLAASLQLPVRLLPGQPSAELLAELTAAAGADSIRNYQKAHPGAPVNLLGFSAGTAEAIFALEVLAETAPVDQVVLLGTSISRDYDMTEALKRVKNKLYIITSTHDQMVGTMMKFSGSADRKFHDPGAGIKGFVLPAGASAATRQLYAEKIVTIPYSDDFRKDGDKGHHFDNVKMAFIRDHVAPLLMGKTTP